MINHGGNVDSYECIVKKKMYSNDKEEWSNMNTLGERIKEERDRLGLSQTKFGLLGGVARVAQANYEADKRVPDASYLAAIAVAGVDVCYIVTGSHGGLQTEEIELLGCYRQATRVGRMAILATARGIEKQVEKNFGWDQSDLGEREAI